MSAITKGAVARSGTAPITLSRRQLFEVCAASASLLQATTATPASAALVQFPANRLANRYFLVRAGLSEEEALNGTVLTNPVWKTSARNGLSQNGVSQIYKQTTATLEALGACEDGCWIWPSITQNCYQTAEILAYQFDIGRSRIVPEYSFLDARGLGAYEGLSVERAGQLMAEGDTFGRLWKPPKGTDGTPNESVEEVFARVRQVLSITETQYRGEDVVFIAPDSDTLAVLQAAVLGRDLNQHRAFFFSPGDARALQLSDQTFDDTPRKFACPNPPSCVPS